MKTYSNASNAIRGFRSANPDNDMTNEQLREHVVESDGGYAVVIEEAPGVAGVNGSGLIKGTGSYKDVPLLRRSDEGGAVAACHEIFDNLEGKTRKEAIAFCVDNGIAFYTARTQYQKWLHRDDVKQAA